MRTPLLALAAAALFLLLPAASAAVDFTKDYSDPASDVMKLDENQNPVVVDGKFVMSPFPSAVNILRLRSNEAGNDITIRLEVKGAILDADNATYTVSLFTDATNQTRHVVEYRNTTLKIWVNTTPSQKTDITGNATVTNQGGGTNNTLLLTIAKSLLGTIDAWDIDATALMVGSPNSYRDYGWLVPGNPGSGPVTPTDGGLLSAANLWWILLLVAGAAVGVLILFAAKRRRQKPT